jgi:hypothetical protein
LPIRFENGLPVLKWLDEWSLDIFSDYKLVWSDEFDNDGAPNPAFWNQGATIGEKTVTM